MRLRQLSLFLVVVLAGPAASPAQDYQDDDGPVAAKALDELLSTLLPEGGPAREEPAAWVAVSRLLPTACDQLRWLWARIKELEQDPNNAAFVVLLTAAAVERGDELASNGHLADCPADLKVLTEAAQRPRVDEWADPNSLAAKVRKDERFHDQPKDRQFELLARGVPVDRIFTSDKLPAWARPWLVIRSLAAEPNLPKFDARQRLRSDLIRYWDDGKAGLGHGLQDSVGASFQIAAAIIDRALGLDSTDAKQVKQEKIEYIGDPDSWTALAETLAEKNLRIWAALAFMLAGSAAKADELWKDVATVDPTLWPAVGSSPDAWIARLGASNRLHEPNQLPLSHDFRATAREGRNRLEKQLFEDFGPPLPDPNSADDIFKLIQRAKAVEAGSTADAPVFDFAGLRRQFGGDGQDFVYLFVEWLELRSVAEAAPDSFVGVAVYCENYEDPTDKNEASKRNKYKTKLLGPSADPQGLVREALKGPGPPPGRRDARILVAPDGPLPPEWFTFEKTELLELIGGAPDSWVVYLPSALALKSVWTEETTAQTWYRSLLQSSSVPRVMTVESGRLSLPDVATSVSGQTIATARFWFQVPKNPPEPSLQAFMDAKRENQLGVLLVWVRK